MCQPTDLPSATQSGLGWQRISAHCWSRTHLAWLTLTHVNYLALGKINYFYLANLNWFFSCWIFVFHLPKLNDQHYHHPGKDTPEFSTGNLWLVHIITLEMKIFLVCTFFCHDSRTLRTHHQSQNSKSLLRSKNLKFRTDLQDPVEPFQIHSLLYWASR